MSFGTIWHKHKDSDTILYYLFEEDGFGPRLRAATGLDNGSLVNLLFFGLSHELKGNRLADLHGSTSKHGWVNRALGAQGTIPFLLGFSMDWSVPPHMVDKWKSGEEDLLYFRNYP